MYTYTAGATGFDACMPPWARDGGYEALFKRFDEPETRARIIADMKTKGSWENLCLSAGSTDRILLVEFKNDALKKYQGKTLTEVAKDLGKTPEDAILDLMKQDQTRVGVVFFLMSEENVKKQIALPWVSFGSDAASLAIDEPFTRSSTHPRSYGNFSRLLGKYVRDEKVISLAEALHRLSGLPATNLGLADRGALRAGAFADVVVFDPAKIADRATFDQPHQYSVGMKDVLRERRAGAEGWRAHGRKARPGPLGTGQDPLRNDTEHSWPTPSRSPGRAGSSGGTWLPPLRPPGSTSWASIASRAAKPSSATPAAGRYKCTACTKTHWRAHSRARPPSSTSRRWVRSGLRQPTTASTSTARAASSTRRIAPACRSAPTSAASAWRTTA